MYIYIYIYVYGHMHRGHTLIIPYTRFRSSATSHRDCFNETISSSLVPFPSSRHFPRFPPTSLSFFFLDTSAFFRFPSRWPGYHHSRCTSQGEWPIDGADNGAAKTRRPSCPQEAAFGILDLNAKLDKKHSCNTLLWL